MTTNDVFNKNDKFLNANVLLSSYSHYSNINNILSFSISSTTSYLFIYDFSKIKSCYFNEAIKIKQDLFVKIKELNNLKDLFFFDIGRFLSSL